VAKFDWENAQPKDSITEKDLCDILSKFIFEWTQQMRHMEILRSNLVQYIYALAAVILAFFATLVKDGGIGSVSWFITLACAAALVSLGVYGWAVIYKTNERYNLARSYRDVFTRALSSRIKSMGFYPEIEQLRHDAELHHYGEHPTVKRTDRPEGYRVPKYLRRFQLHVAWSVMCLIVAAAGPILLLLRALP
jgi:hypothetical protein